MKELQGKSMNIVQDNIEKLKEIFPEIFIEGKIDFEVLKQLLGEKIKTNKERYSFTWNGKSEARQIAQDTSTGTLRPSKEDSKDWDNTENLYIEGDNLEVLKLLQKSYHGKIKMIYIDPPYNTGKDFVYKDNFKDNLKNYLEMTGQLGENGQRLSTNSDSNGRYHSDWLNMMYPRLKLARNLLTDDGVIFISIDDTELAQLKLLCNEVFGEKNYIENFCWNKTTTPPSLSSTSRSDIDYILVYQKNSVPKQFNSNKVDIKETDSPVENKDNPVGELLLKEGWVDCKLENGIYEKEKYGDGKLLDNLIVKDGKNINNFRMKSNFKWSQEYLEEEMKNGTKLLIKSTKISLRYLKSEDRKKIMPPNKLIDMKFGVGTNDNAKLEMKKLGIEFSYPKPVSLIKYLLNFIKDKNCIVLDFFSGSSTTAHAVIELNAEDSGNRKYIMVQLPEICDEKSEAYKEGYKNICEIGKERIRRAGEKIKEEIEKENSQLKLGEEPKKLPDIGFKVFKLDSSNIKEWDTETDNLKQMLLNSVDNIKSDRTSLDILYEILLKYGLDLNVPIEEKEDFYSIGGGTLLVNLNKEIDMEVIDSICEEYRNLLEIDEDFKTTVVLRDSAFKDDVDKTNAMKKLEQAGIKEVRSI